MDSEIVILIIFLFGLLLLTGIINGIDDIIDRKRVESVFAPGNIIKEYRMKSKVFDYRDCIGKYEIIGTKDRWMRLRNTDTNEENEKEIDDMVEYADCCEVYGPDGALLAVYRKSRCAEYHNRKGLFGKKGDPVANNVNCV